MPNQQPDNQRAVYVLYAFGYSLEQISARVPGVTQSDIADYLSNARQNAGATNATGTVLALLPQLSPWQRAQLARASLRLWPDSVENSADLQALKVSIDSEFCAWAREDIARILGYTSAELASIYRRQQFHAAQLLGRSVTVEGVTAMWALRPRLTPRQWMIVRLCAQGKLRKEISAQVGIAESTIRTHVSAARRLLRFVPSTPSCTLDLVQWWHLVMRTPEECRAWRMSQDGQRVQEWWSNLSGECRTVLSAWCDAAWTPYSYAKLAQRMGRREQTVDQLITTALVQYRKAMLPRTLRIQSAVYSNLLRLLVPVDMPLP